VIRISCPLCAKAFKISEEKAGRAVTCPRCGELVAAKTSAAGKDEPRRRSPTPEPEQRRGLFRGMSRRVRWAVAGVVGVGAASLLLGVAWGVPVFICSVLVVLAVLYGQATGCPACGKWWARMLLKKDLVVREALDEAGVPCEKLMDQTTYRCAGCGYTWSVMDTEAIQESGRRPQPHGG
jgi:DNA-directed RNA polymerase subunit RPC12/RpoP